MRDTCRSRKGRSITSEVMEIRTDGCHDHGMKENSDLGVLLRQWRNRRRYSQLDLAGEAEISTRHLSFIETGKARASRATLMRLAATLDLPPRETNMLLLAGGYAPMDRLAAGGEPYAGIETPLSLLLEGHHPYPAIAIDRYWTIRKANRAVATLLEGVSPHLLEAPMNAVRIALHPQGLAPSIINYAQWRHHLLTRLRQQVRLTDDDALKRLLAEAESYPVPANAPHGERPIEGPVIPLRLRSAAGVLRLISTTTIFGTPVDVEISELAIETFFPADEETRRILQAMG